MKIPLKDLEQTAFLVESLYRTRQETIKVCHILLQNPRFFQLLLQIDIDLAAQTRAVKCQCGGTLHKADYPRKPRGCPSEARADYESRFSFCCSQCRKQKLQGQVYQCSILLPHPSPASPNNSPHSGEMHAEVVCDLLVRITSCRVCRDDVPEVGNRGKTTLADLLVFHASRTATPHLHSSL